MKRRAFDDGCDDLRRCATFSAWFHAYAYIFSQRVHEKNHPSKFCYVPKVRLFSTYSLDTGCKIERGSRSGNATRRLDVAIGLGETEMCSEYQRRRSGDVSGILYNTGVGHAGIPLCCKVSDYKFRSNQPGNASRRGGSCPTAKVPR